MTTPLTKLQEIAITETEVVTPAGAFARATTRMTLGQFTPVRRLTGVWIVLAILFIPCTAGLSLFLLLIKENTGEVDVPLHVVDGIREYRTVLRAADWQEYILFTQIVNWANTK